MRRRRRTWPSALRRILARNGYTDVRILAGGVAAWGAAGFELFSGVNVPSKAFGEYVEHANDTPNIAAGELEAADPRRRQLVVLDSRPFDEYSRVSIPTSTNVPGAELVLRAREIAPSAETMVVVNCAGRTRSIIGAQSLINAGLPNKVMALRNGTMGWSLAGFTCDSGKNRRAPEVSPKTLDWARHAAQQVAEGCGVRSHRPRRRSTPGARTANARSICSTCAIRPNMKPATCAGAISAPGGQLVQATDQYVGTLGARIVAHRRRRGARRDDGVVAAPDGLCRRVRAGRSGNRNRPAGNADLDAEDTAHAAIDCAALGELLARDEATVVDLSLSRDYLARHIPGAWFAIRTRLERALAAIPLQRHAGAHLARTAGWRSLAVAEAEALADRPVRFLEGGNAAWRAAGKRALDRSPDGGRSHRSMAQAL